MEFYLYKFDSYAIFFNIYLFYKIKRQPTRNTHTMSNADIVLRQLFWQVILRQIYSFHTWMEELGCLEFVKQTLN